jgi:hypothetical protein
LLLHCLNDQYLYICTLKSGNALKRKRVISKTVLVKWGLFLLLLGAAWMYDHSHQNKLTEKITTDKPTPQKETAGYNFFFTPQVSNSLKVPVQKIIPEKLYQEKLIRLLQEHLAVRSVFLLKAEVLRQPSTLLSLRNLISIRYYSQINPDDDPPAC